MRTKSLHALLMDYLKLQRRLGRALRGAGLQACAALRQDPAKLRKRLERLSRRLEALLGRARTAALAAGLALSLASARAQAFSFTESNFNGNNLVANVSIPYLSSSRRAVSFVDMDGDGVQDLVLTQLEQTNTAPLLFKGSLSGGKLSFTAVPTAQNPLSVTAGTYYGNNYAFADVDGDGDLDVVVSVQGLYNSPKMAFYRNTGSATNPHYAQVTGSANPVSNVPTTSEQRAFFADLRGTGTPDLFVMHTVGGTSNVIDDFVNTSGSLNPIAPASSNPFNGMSWPITSYRYNNAVPVVVDLNHDGLLDVVIPVSNGGTLLYYKNTGADAQHPVLTQQTGSNNPFNNVASSGSVNLAFTDMDGNGTLDAVYPGNASLHYLKNKGSLSAPVFAEEGINGANFLRVAFADLDGNGVKAYTPISSTHKLQAWANIGTPSSPQWESVDPSQNPIGSLVIAGSGTPIINFVDIHGSGLLGIASMNNELLDYYDNVGSPTSPSFTQLTGASNPFKLATHVYTAPLTADLDGDGTPDLIIPASSGGYVALNPNNVRFFKNTGTLASPVFTELSGTGSAIDAIPATGGGALIKAPDGSGLFDFVQQGGSNPNVVLNYYKNTGSSTVPAFTLQSGGSNPFNSISFQGTGDSAIAVDANSDGNTDLAVIDGQSTQLRWLLAPPAATPTITPTSTKTATPTLSPTSTVSPSFTVTGSPSPSASPSDTATVTPTPSITPSPSASPTFTASPSITLTSTFCAGCTDTPTNTPVFAKTNAGHPVMGPVPARAGGIVTLHFDAAPASSGADIYNLAGTKVASLAFGGDPNPGWNTGHIAPGLYLAVINVTYADGSKKTTTQKIVLVP
jgi:hypothetical protein